MKMGNRRRKHEPTETMKMQECRHQRRAEEKRRRAKEDDADREQPDRAGAVEASIYNVIARRKAPEKDCHIRAH